MNEEKATYYGLGKNWGYAELNDADEGFRLDTYEYVIKVYSSENAGLKLDPIDAQGRKIPLVVGDFKCLEIRGANIRNAWSLHVKIQDKDGVIKERGFWGGLRYPVMNRFKELLSFMEMLNSIGTWEEYDRIEEARMLKEKMEKLENKNSMLAQENANLKEKLDQLTSAAASIEES